MISTIKILSAGARSWWREYRALPRESKHLFVTVALGLIFVYFMLTGMSKLSGRLERGVEMVNAVQRLSPQAADSIRAACHGRWETSDDCGLFYLLRESAR